MLAIRLTALVTLLLCLAGTYGMPSPRKEEPPRITAEPALDSLEGVWLVTNSAYDGAAVIRRAGDAWLVVYSTGDQKKGAFSLTTTVGVGIRTGDALAVGWSQGDKSAGVTVYTLRGRTLAGRWVMAPGGGLQEETLTFLKALPARSE